ncbi:uncharacterized protein AC631_05898, partial [Debaryomyces fabryi]
MVHRDLTYNTPSEANLTEEGVENPFVSPNDDESSFDLSPASSSSQLNDFNQLSNQLNDPNYGGTFDSYNGYYTQNGTTSNLLSKEASPNIGNTGNSSFQPSLIPPEYDRYPSMVGSRVVSSTSLSSHMYNSTNNLQQDDQNLRKSEDDSSISNKSTNPFLLGTDFSPFGGYPASSFPLHIDEKEPDDYLHNPDPI